MAEEKRRLSLMTLVIAFPPDFFIITVEPCRVISPSRLTDRVFAFSRCFRRTVNEETRVTSEIGRKNISLPRPFLSREFFFFSSSSSFSIEKSRCKYF